ncbi:glycerophosphodiester phosphodiesterase 1-like isoform X2 [Anabas testudineus]|uniref:glycerophosphodiester phosphodiesterase 1-like isoform X2 n=1 Tax=Anabas testudineus TaxID=64144 RepID=UPI000E45F93A|nr:glycerophosphodiester phosphodiesterase 1-like isoform X2 [Anabas testudineus]
MLQVGDEVVYFSAVFLLVMLGTRSATGASLVTAFLYIFMMMFRFPPVPADQAGRVLRPRTPSGGVPVVAHRGGCHDAPENTLAAIREVRLSGWRRGAVHGLASRNGATGVELDLSFTADGVPILMHDETVDRTTNGSGPVGKLQFVQLRRLDAAARHRLKNKFIGEKVPTLQEAVEECIKHQLTIFIDVRGQPDKAASALHAMYKKFPVLYNSSIVSSFEPKVIYKMRQTDPNVVTALTHRPWRLSRFSNGTLRPLSTWGQLWTGALDVLLDWALHHILWKLCGVSAILMHKDFISLDYVQYWAERGVVVGAWTVNTAVEKRYYQNLLKISYITDSLLDCDPHC